MSNSSASSAAAAAGSSALSESKIPSTLHDRFVAWRIPHEVNTNASTGNSMSESRHRTRKTKFSTLQPNPSSSKIPVFSHQRRSSLDSLAFELSLNSLRRSSAPLPFNLAFPFLSISSQSANSADSSSSSLSSHFPFDSASESPLIDVLTLSLSRLLEISRSQNSSLISTRVITLLTKFQNEFSSVLNNNKSNSKSADQSSTPSANNSNSSTLAADSASTGIHSPIHSPIRSPVKSGISHPSHSHSHSLSASLNSSPSTHSSTNSTSNSSISGSGLFSLLGLNSSQIHRSPTSALKIERPKNLLNKPRVARNLSNSNTLIGNSPLKSSTKLIEITTNNTSNNSNINNNEDEISIINNGSEINSINSDQSNEFNPNHSEASTSSIPNPTSRNGFTVSVKSSNNPTTNINVVSTNPNSTSTSSSTATDSINSPLHDRLSSPERRKFQFLSSEAAKKELESKQLKAAQLRELEAEKLREKLRQANQRQTIVEKRKSSKLHRIALETDNRLETAIVKHEDFIEEIRRKAESENQKVKEVAFITEQQNESKSMQMKKKLEIIENRKKEIINNKILSIKEKSELIKSKRIKEKEEKEKAKQIIDNKLLNALKRREENNNKRKISNSNINNINNNNSNNNNTTSNNRNPPVEEILLNNNVNYNDDSNININNNNDWMQSSIDNNSQLFNYDSSSSLTHDFSVVSKASIRNRKKKARKIKMKLLNDQFNVENGININGNNENSLNDDNNSANNNTSNDSLDYQIRIKKYSESVLSSNNINERIKQITNLILELSQLLENGEFPLNRLAELSKLLVTHQLQSYSQFHSSSPSTESLMDRNEEKSNVEIISSSMATLSVTNNIDYASADYSNSLTSLIASFLSYSLYASLSRFISSPLQLSDSESLEYWYQSHKCINSLLSNSAIQFVMNREFLSSSVRFTFQFVHFIHRIISVESINLSWDKFLSISFIFLSNILSKPMTILLDSSSIIINRTNPYSLVSSATAASDLLTYRHRLLQYLCISGFYDHFILLFKFPTIKRFHSAIGLFLRSFNSIGFDIIQYIRANSNSSNNINIMNNPNKSNINNNLSEYTQTLNSYLYHSGHMKLFHIFINNLNQIMDDNEINLLLPLILNYIEYSLFPSFAHRFNEFYSYNSSNSSSSASAASLIPALKRFIQLLSTRLHRFSNATISRALNNPNTNTTNNNTNTTNANGNKIRLSEPEETKEKLSNNINEENNNNLTADDNSNNTNTKDKEKELIPSNEFEEREISMLMRISVSFLTIIAVFSQNSKLFQLAIGKEVNSNNVSNNSASSIPQSPTISALSTSTTAATSSSPTLLDLLLTLPILTSFPLPPFIISSIVAISFGCPANWRLLGSNAAIAKSVTQFVAVKSSGRWEAGAPISLKSSSSSVRSHNTKSATSGRARNQSNPLINNDEINNPNQSNKDKDKDTAANKLNHNEGPNTNNSSHSNNYNNSIVSSAAIVHSNSVNFFHSNNNLLPSVNSIDLFAFFNKK